MTSNITLPTRSEAEARKTLMRWQPIATCPKDDIPMNPGVILWDGRYVTVGWWCDLDGWQEAINVGDQCDNTMKPQPTHWMPFPAPPTSEQMPDGEGKASQPDKAQVIRRGPLDMQVCVPKDWSDEQIKKFANLQNLCGTEHGWHIRKQGDEALGGDPERNPCQQSPSTHVHLVLDA
jgi:hypothetical protein